MLTMLPKESDVSARSRRGNGISAYAIIEIGSTAFTAKNVDSALLTLIIPETTYVQIATSHRSA